MNICNTAEAMRLANHMLEILTIKNLIGVCLVGAGPSIVILIGKRPNGLNSVAEGIIVGNIIVGNYSVASIAVHIPNSDFVIALGISVALLM